MKRPRRRVTPEQLWRHHIKFTAPLEARFAADYRKVMTEMRDASRASAKSPFALEAWKRKVAQAMRPAYGSAIANGGRQFLTATAAARQKVVGGYFSKAPAKKRAAGVVVALEREFRERIEETVETTWEALQDIMAEAVADDLDPDEVGDLIDEEWDDILGRRTDAIAVTETNGAVNSVRDYLMLELVELQSWITALDDRVRPTHAIYGEAGPKPSGFDWAQLADDAGYTLRYPCDPRCHEPAEVVNCRCFVTPSGELEFTQEDLKDYLEDFEMDPEDVMRSEDQAPVYVVNQNLGKAFDPDQPRDDYGRWTDIFGNSIPSDKAPEYQTEDPGAPGYASDLADAFESKGITKGDFEGHPFRGNQWTTGEGGADSPMSEEDKVDARLGASGTRLAVEKVMLDNESDYDKIERLGEMRSQLHGELLRKHGITTLYSTSGPPVAMKDAQATVAMGEMKRSVANMPQGVLDGIEARGGLQLELTDRDETFTVQAPGGTTVEFKRGGSAIWEDSEGRPRVTINVRSGGSPGLMVEVLDHEMGHIAIDSVGDTRQYAERVSVAAELSSDLTDLRRSIGRAYTERDATIGDFLPGRPDSDAPLNAALYELQRWTDGEGTRLSEAGYGRLQSLREFEQAIATEGGVTEYAETWNKDPTYGHKGTVHDPVHRGAHESFAEIESGFAKVAKVSDVTPKSFAAMMAQGVDVPLHGWISKTRPATAAAWLAIREHAERWSPKSRIPKRIKELRALVVAMNKNRPMQQLAQFSEHFDKLTGRL